MVSLCFYFQVHQPFRVKKYRIFDIGSSNNYFDEDKNRAIMNKVARKCYLPMNNLLLELINKYKSNDRKFKVAFSISGVALEQMKLYAPEVLESFQKLVETGYVELLTETYYHSLSFLYSKEEFKEQVEEHKKTIKKLFNGYEPKVFRNTELIYSNEVAKYVEGLGFEAILAEGWDTFLGWRSSNFVYKPVGCKKIKLLTKNYKLSDDIAFRFSNKAWEEWPLTVEKYVSWLNSVNGNGEVINLFMDYETFGEHQWEDTGIFEFMKKLPEEFLKHPDNDFVFPSEAVKKYPVRDELDIPFLISWADTERDLSAWLGNRMQQNSIKELFEIEKEIKEISDDKLIKDWKKLTTSDHFYYMCTKYWADGDVHKYFSAYDSPYDAYVYFMNAFNDVILRLREEQTKINENYKVQNLTEG